MRLLLVLAVLFAGPALAEGCVVTGDRGIGGTGQLADRGIGGTGAPGVMAVHGRISGFGSVCVDGLEIGVDAATPVRVDGQAAAVGALRVGQVVWLDVARGADGAMQARAVRVEHAVVGPVEAMGAGLWRVAGQEVVPAPGAVVAGGVAVGDWVAVAGLRDLRGVIRASRVDRAAAGRVRVAGVARRVGGVVRVGGLELLGGEAVEGPVVAEGAYAGTGMRVAQLRRGWQPGGERLVVTEGHGAVTQRVLRLGDGVEARVPDGVLVPEDGEEPLVAVLAVQEDGGMQVVAAREGAGGQGMAQGKAPPERGSGGPGAPGGGPGGPEMGGGMGGGKGGPPR